MTVVNLNNAAVTSASYTDALTVVFGFARNAFALHTFNSAIYYKLGSIPLGTGRAGSPEWEAGEHYLAPSLSVFDDAPSEGLPAGSQFAGIQIRSAVSPVPASPARVTVA